jgi:hypothetical protein
MSSLSNEKLIKRARHAGTNLWTLAVLASLAAIGFIAGSLSEGLAGGELRIFGVMLALLAGGYWVLGTAARRGDQRSVGIVVVVLVLHICAVVASGFLIASRRKGAAPFDGTSMLGAGVGFLVLLVLARNYRELVELRKRGLWDQIFGSCNPSGHLCVAGGLMFVAGVLGIYVSSVYSVSRLRAREMEMQQAQAFINMIRTEEQDFLAAMKGSGGPAEPVRVETALDALGRLEQKALLLQKDSSKNEALGAILSTYLGSTNEYKAALAMLQQPNPDIEQVRKKLLAGDDLRRDAGNRFDQRYSSAKGQ